LITKEPIDQQVGGSVSNDRDKCQGGRKKGFEQARVTDQQEIERLKSDLEQMHQSAQTSQTQVSQQEEKIKLLQSKLIYVENQVIDIIVFQSQAMEI
jgi:hypothetical protein